MRDKIFPAAAAESGSKALSAQEAETMFRSGVTTLASGDFEGAKTEFAGLGANPRMPQPQKSWAILNAALANFLLGDPQSAYQLLGPLNKAGPYSLEPVDQTLANLFVEVSRTLLEKKPVSSTIRTLYTDKKEVFALLIFGIYDWEVKSSFDNAAELLSSFQRRVNASTWEAEYKPLAEKYLADWKPLEPLLKGLPKATSPEAASTLLKTLRSSRSEFQTGTKVSEQLDAIEKELISKGAKP